MAIARRYQAHLNALLILNAWIKKYAMKGAVKMHAYLKNVVKMHNAVHLTIMQPANVILASVVPLMLNVTRYSSQLNQFWRLDVQVTTNALIILHVKTDYVQILVLSQMYVPTWPPARFTNTKLFAHVQMATLEVLKLIAVSLPNQNVLWIQIALNI